MEASRTIRPELALARVPKHVAIIMDGNGRWAQERGWHRTIGHAQGVSRVKDVIREADKLGVKVLTLYCFSTENWKRPSSEISALMGLLKDYLEQERQDIIDNNIRFQALGQIDRLPKVIYKNVLRTINETRENTGLVLNFCISYGARAEIVRAMQMIAHEVQEKRLALSEIDEKLVSDCLYTSGLPDPDLIIRTSGEYRISNFLLWQAAYSEIYVTDTLWPDFEPSHLRAALESFATRHRRFGSSDEVVTLESRIGKETSDDHRA